MNDVLIVEMPVPATFTARAKPILHTGLQRGFPDGFKGQKVGGLAGTGVECFQAVSGKSVPVIRQEYKRPAGMGIAGVRNQRHFDFGQFSGQGGYEPFRMGRQTDEPVPVRLAGIGQAEGIEDQSRIRADRLI